MNNVVDEKGFFAGNLCDKCSRRYNPPQGYKLQKITWSATCDVCGEHTSK